MSLKDKLFGLDNAGYLVTVALATHYHSPLPLPHIPLHVRKKIIKNERRCRNGVPKCMQTRKDKSDGKYTKPHPSLHLYSYVKRCRDGALYTYHHALLSFLVCVLFGTPFLHLSFLMIFLSCFCTFLVTHIVK